MKQYSALAMLYASHVVEGKRKIEEVPMAVRPFVQEIVMDAQN